MPRSSCQGTLERVVFVTQRKEFTPGFQKGSGEGVASGIGVVHLNTELVLYDSFYESDEIRLVKHG
jgi:hypothetical protein